jgi:hypothetical protein
MPKLSRTRVEQIIREEIKLLREENDVKKMSTVSDVVTSAEKLRTAIEKFQADASESQIGALAPDLEKIKKMIDSMLAGPTAWMDKTVEPEKSKRVVLTNNDVPEKKED